MVKINRRASAVVSIAHFQKARAPPGISASARTFLPPNPNPNPKLKSQFRSHSAASVTTIAGSNHQPSRSSDIGHESFKKKIVFYLVS